MLLGYKHEDGWKTKAGKERRRSYQLEIVLHNKKKRSEGEIV